MGWFVSGFGLGIGACVISLGIWVENRGEFLKDGSLLIDGGGQVLWIITGLMFPLFIMPLLLLQQFLDPVRKSRISVYEIERTQTDRVINRILLCGIVAMVIGAFVWVAWGWP